MAAFKNMQIFLFSKYFSDSLRCVLLPKLSFLRKSHSVESFKFSDLQIDMATEAQKFPKPDPDTLVFGEHFSDHMFQVNWNLDNGWNTPEIVPIHLFSCHPGSKVFHYAQAIFEGMKAYKCSDGSINLFRPNLNIERLLASAERASLPLFDGEEFLKCLKKLISIDKEWIPNYSSSALYIRPTFIGNENKLKPISSNTALLYVITCPVKPYLKNAQSGGAVSLLADPTFVRAWPGGVGDMKMACSYANSLYIQKIAHKQDIDEVLWLFGDNHQIAEAGSSNVFFFFQRGLNEFELATPALDGTILPGITRRSILELARQYKEFEVSERMITMDEIVEAAEMKTLKEVFLCGTAVVLCPVNKIRYGNNDISIPTMNDEIPLYLRLYRDLTDIQYGRVESEWAVKIE